MAASLWTQSLSVLSVARVCRSSRGAAALHALRAGRFSSVRHASASAQVQERSPHSEEPKPSSHSFREPAQPAERKHEEPASPHADQPKFDTLQGSVDPRVLRNLTGNPFNLVHMSSVQAAVLPRVPQLSEPYDPDKSSGPRDLLVKARTGTGKTLAFLVPAVEARLKRLREHSEQVAKDIGKSDKATLSRAVERFARENIGALIISPTRELATQIANEAIRLTRSVDRFEVRLVVGGLSKRTQLREWNTGRRDIIVATPGRLRDLIENEKDIADHLKTTDMLVMDEADTLLDMGFRDDIQAIVDELKPSPERQTFMFSATVSKAIQQVAAKSLSRNHEFINCVPDDAPPTHLAIPQYYTNLPSAKDQLPHILRLIAEDQLLHPNSSKVLVFLPTTSLVQLYSTILNEVGPRVFPAGHRTRFGELHSKRSMSGRVSTSKWFREAKDGSIVMITSDVSARGVDYPGVTRVIQVGVPSSAEAYVHRVGRTGRGMSMDGRADLVLMPWERSFLTWKLSDIPLKELTTKELEESVRNLARANDEMHLKDGERTPFPPRALEKVERMQERIGQLQEGLSAQDVRDAMVAALAFYNSNYTELRVERDAAAKGVHEWAAALIGQEIMLRLPAEHTKSRKLTSPFRRRDDRPSGQRADDDFRGSSGYRSRGRSEERSYSRRDEPRSYDRRNRGEDGERSFSRRRDEDGERRYRRDRDEQTSWGSKSGRSRDD